MIIGLFPVLRATEAGNQKVLATHFQMKLKAPKKQYSNKQLPFYQLPGTNQVDPSWRYEERFPVQNVQASMAVDCHLKTHPIKVPVKDPKEIGALFDHAITYNKGYYLRAVYERGRRPL